MTAQYLRYGIIPLLFRGINVYGILGVYACPHSCISIPDGVYSLMSTHTNTIALLPPIITDNHERAVWKTFENTPNDEYPAPG